MKRKNIRLITEVEQSKFDFKVNHQSKIVTIGSCFSDTLGDFLTENKFRTLSNPFGTVYNIQSVSDLFLTALGEKKLEKDWFVQRDETFFHHSYHSGFFGNNVTHLRRKINSVNRKVSTWLKETDLLVITLGTSWVYLKDGAIVSNCHRQPANTFDKKLIPAEEQSELLAMLLIKLKNINPKMKVVLTVSPVRHLKDGLVENSVSKSILRLVCSLITSQMDEVYYFPSYEIMIDELRDYRFYEEDLIHPNKTARSYITQRFMNSVMVNKTLNLINDWEGVLRSLNHRPINSKSKSHQKFLRDLKRKVIRFKPYFDISSELKKINSGLERT